MTKPNTVYQFECKDHRGDVKSLSDFTGQVLLIVNTASKCGFTPQYTGLEKLHQDFHQRGFSVLGFPCNQFGNQERFLRFAYANITRKEITDVIDRLNVSFNKP